MDGKNFWCHRLWHLKALCLVNNVSPNRLLSAHVSVFCPQSEITRLWIVLTECWKKLWVVDERWRSWELSIRHFHRNDMSAFSVVLSIFVLSPSKLTLKSIVKQFIVHLPPRKREEYGLFHCAHAFLAATYDLFVSR